MDRRKESIEIRSDGKCNRRGCKYKFNDLCNACNEPDIFPKCFPGIVEYTAGLWNGTGQFCIAEGEGKVHGHNHQGSDSHAQGSAFFKAEVPTEIHSRDYIAYA